MRRVLTSLILASALIAGCSDSSTDQTAANDGNDNMDTSQGGGDASADDGNTGGSDSNTDDGNTGGSDSNTDDGNTGGSDSNTDNGNTGGSDSNTDDGNTGGSDSNTDDGNTGGSDSNTDDGNTGGSDSNTDDGNTGGSDSNTGDGNTGGSDTPTVVKFTGGDFNYPPVYPASYFPPGHPDNLDPRVSYTVWATNYVQAHALLETMHAINFYRDEDQQIKEINGGIETRDSLIADYCPTTGDNWAPQRCAFYAQLAHSKTSAQDPWQMQLLAETHSPGLLCGYSATMVQSCYYQLFGYQVTGESNSPSITLSLGQISPIERWHYEHVASDKIVRINFAAQDFYRCAYSNHPFGPEDGMESAGVRNRATVSLWPGYNRFTVWALVPDVYEDVHRDLVADHPVVAGCSEQFAEALKAIEPAANL